MTAILNALPATEPASHPPAQLQGDAGLPTPMPHRFIGLARLMRQAFSGIDLKPAAGQLIAHAQVFPQDAPALMDLSTMLLLTGHRALALSTQLEALQMQQLYSLPSARPTRLRLLVMLAPGDLMANTPVEFLVEDSDIALDLMYVGLDIPALAEVPDHDVLFVAIGESDDNAPLLAALDPILADWPRPVVNHAAHIAQLTRNGASSLLQDVPGLSMPPSVRMSRQAVMCMATDAIAPSDLIAGAGYPLIIRPVGSHAGHDLDRIDSPGALAAYLERVGGDEFYLSQFIDYRSADGLFRKYRIMLIDGLPYISHLAISSHWMIHYLNAGMADDAGKRAEEAAFMAVFETEFAVRHAAAFTAIAERTGLSYVGIDCGQTPAGELLVFEVDSDMIVHAMDPAEQFGYKKAPMQRLFCAFQAMLARAAGI
jgi:glutathione synthase/RimK-type ligase-like ATP-grasp enzyme